MSNFWSAWIIILTSITLVLVVWLLIATRRMKQQHNDNTTGHEYDGIIEEDNPLPQWWLIMFALSIVFGVGYLVVFPGLGSFEGLLGWSSQKQHNAETARLEQKFSQNAGQLAELSISELLATPSAINAGRRLFANNCAVCHGSDGSGAYGFPNLADDIWQWGGSHDQILHSITYGRQAQMPAWENILSRSQLTAVTEYILSPTDTNATTHADGKQSYNLYCASCHGPELTGNAMLGAPSLIDDEWLYGGSTNEVLTSIRVGRTGVMLAQGDILGTEKIRLIAAYVLSLGNTAADAAPSPAP